MFAIDHVKQCFVLLDEIEKDVSYFTQTQRQAIYRFAFHKENFEEVQRFIMQVSAPNLSTEERGMLLEHHIGKLSGISNNVKQIEDYIFQLHHMTYETDKANRMLEEILSRSGIREDLDVLIAEMQGRERKEARPDRNERTK